MTERITIGVDVGLSGAVAVLEGPRVVVVDDLPVVVIQRGQGKRHEYAVSKLAEMLREYALRASAVAFVEAQQAFPGQGVASQFSIGRGMGMIEGILTALQCPFEFVRPQAWKREFAIPPKSEKSSSLVIAQRLFPFADLGRRKDAGRADALLIAEYGRRRLGA